MTTARVGVDVGGTFTDVALLADGDLVTAKVPSTADQSEGVMRGIMKACETADIDLEELTEFTHAMTVSVNALLEGDGAKTALVTTEGFRDVLEIGRQDRPALYDLDAEKPDPLVPRRRRFELPERTTVDGVESAVRAADVREVAREIEAADAESVAVCLLHAYADSENEARTADLLREELSIPVTASHEVMAAFREYERTSTTAVETYVTPAIDDYVGRLTERAAAAGVPDPRIMQSNGGIADAETVRANAVTTVLSGPAAGVVGAAATATEVAGESDLAGLVTFDMGGTSSDVSLVRDGGAARTTDTDIGGHAVGVPMVDVNTVGSGGGSVAWVDAGGALRVGPRSAGADPGPACYGRGGTEPTVTDANVVLGYIGESTALGGELSLDVSAAEKSLESLAEDADLDSAREAAAGVHRVANAKMTRAIRSVTVERGYDPRNFGLVAFGGAGPMHATGLADRLDIETVILPLAGGVLSAYGLLDADEKSDAVRTHRTRLDEVDIDAIERTYDALTDEVLADVTGETGGEEDTTVERTADLRYVGQSFELEITVTRFDPETLAERFAAAHERAYGYRADEPVELVNLRATATVERGVKPTDYEGRGDPHLGSREAWFGGEHHEATVFDRRSLAPGGTVGGPAVLEQAESTAVVPPAWSGTVRNDGSLVLRREGEP